MPFNKMILFEAAVLALFAVSLFMFYQLMVSSNGVSVSGGFKESSLSGAIRLALDEKGKTIKTADFNFFETGTISAAKLLKDLNNALEAGQLCLALGDARRAFAGGAENGSGGIIRYSPSKEAYKFAVLCYRSNFLAGQLANSSEGLEPYYFSNCGCLENKQQTCCVAALVKG